MQKLESFRKSLESHVPQQAILNTSISEGSVGWHLEHSLMVLNAVMSYMIKSNPEDYKWKFNKIRLMIFTMNKIPRGKGDAPEYVVPKKEFDLEKVTQMLREAEENIKALGTLTKQHNFKHPLFGQLDKKRSLKFMHIHTNHHLAIMKDICAASTADA